MYDEALVADLRRIVDDDRITITPPDNVFRTIGRIADDKIEFPLISLTRTGWSISNNRPHFMKHEGVVAGYDDISKKYKRVQSIPIRISYQVDVWTKTRIDNDNILRELIFYYSVHPTMKIVIPYGLNIEIDFNIFIDEDIEDNSDIIDHWSKGQYFRQTFSIYTDDAYLWKSSSRFPTFVDVNIDVKE